MIQARHLGLLPATGPRNNAATKSCNPAQLLIFRFSSWARNYAYSDSRRHGLPVREDGVVGWTQAQFRNEVFTADTHTFNLVKACMLVALEEEAAAAGRNSSLPHSLSSRLPLEKKASSGSGHVADIGSASTWNLKRLEALAMEAAAEFYHICAEADALDAVHAAVHAGAKHSTLLTVYSDLVAAYPTNLISAINTVLFERHGYRRMRKHGDPKDASLGFFLEHGHGGPGVLAVLYMTVAELCGLNLAACPLDDGRYFALWPADPAIVLGAGGERFIIDPYAQGSLLSEYEVGEMFGVDIPLGAAPASAIMAALLAPLRDAHWCQAIGCPPEPAFMVPIDVDLILGQFEDVSVSYDNSFLGSDASSGAAGYQSQQWWPVKGYSLERALAAAQKIRWLLPQDGETALQLGILYFFSGAHDAARRELVAAAALFNEMRAEDEVAKVKLLAEKARLMAEFEKGPGTETF